MTIFVSDTHFGRLPGPEDRASERELVACIRQRRPDLEGLYLVGDIFEHYVEYKHLVPKGFVRFQALLGELSDEGVPVKYIVGNHDPWHRDYFSSELGVEVIYDHVVEPLHGLNVYVAHGDGLGTESGVYPYLKPLLRHRIPVALYRGILPSDLGMRLARWYSRTFRSESVNETRARSLRQAALALLDESDCNLVVMGHSHVAELSVTTGGTYVNCGCWYSDRTVAVLDANGPALKRWSGSDWIDFVPEGVHAID